MNVEMTVSKKPLVTVEDWRAYVERLSYKPGWRIYVMPAVLPGEYPQLIVEAAVLDVVRQERMIPVILAEPFPMYCTADYMPVFVRRVIERVERHEMDEWLKIDGKHLNDPHPKEAK